MLQETESDQVIHFVCDHCAISLTVDSSLGGVTGPCPSCGKSITAPVLEVPDNFLKESFGDRSDHKESVHGASNRGRDRQGNRTKARIENDYTKVDRKRSNVSIIAKMLILGILVLGVVLVWLTW